MLSKTFVEPEPGFRMLPLSRCFEHGHHGRGALDAGFYEYGRPAKTKQTGLIELS
jgi:hypothetical protein